MATENPAQIIEELKKKLGKSPQKIDDYVKEGDVYANQGKYNVAAGIYNLAAELAPDGHPAHKKRHDSLRTWLDQPD